MTGGSLFGPVWRRCRSWQAWLVVAMAVSCVLVRGVSPAMHPEVVWVADDGDVFAGASAQTASPLHGFDVEEDPYSQLAYDEPPSVTLWAQPPFLTMCTERWFGRVPEPTNVSYMRDGRDEVRGKGCARFVAVGWFVGRVIDASTGSPIVGATVERRRFPPHSVVTDGYGAFTIGLLVVGDSKVSVSAPGFAPRDVSVITIPRRPIVMDVELSRSGRR